MDRALPARATAAVAIAIAHAAALYLIAMQRPAQRAQAPSADTSILVFLPEPARAPEDAVPAASPANEIPAPPSDARPRPHPQTSAITIDWALAAESASARAFAQTGERERQLAAFAPKPSPEVDLSPPPNPAPEFGWNRAATDRIEPLEGGGTYVHLNDRCGIVFAVVILPVCSLGRIPVRGDLFENME